MTAILNTVPVIDIADIDAEITYVKFTKAGKDTVRVETKDENDLDSWPTFYGMFTRDEAIKMVQKNGWYLVDSWQTAMRLAGFYAKTALV